ncbi:MAG: hypothetical protein JZU65_02955 [Chlorobium sp.]|jgi:predicted lipoprotein with Yx(FWY)xxD motif|nr:hypothetical protein [Chlorobium sp.]
MKKLSILFLALIIVAAATVSASAKCKYPGIEISEKQGVGHYLTDDNGMALYWFTKDSPGTSTCAGPCLEKWPAFYHEKFVKPKALSMEEFGTIMRADGKPQLTFRGYPLYLFTGDKAAGNTNGQGVNNVWFVINPGNFPPK